jgi:regulator of protease activity HflC (stomatin/prohibitin superfamily)
MFGICFVKSQPTTYLMQFKGGVVAREGAGLSFFYYAPTTSLVAVPVGSHSEDFIFEHVTADFQGVTVQGQVTYRVGDPRKTAAMLNFALRADGRTYASEDPEKLPQRVIGVVQVLTQKAIKDLRLKAALQASSDIAEAVAGGLAEHAEVQSLGLEILGVAILSVRPTPETARALEAEAREAILKAADDAIFIRRNAAVENERAIRESELDTDIAVEHKKRTIRETQMEAEASIRARKAELRQQDMEADIALEERRRDFVGRNAENIRTLAEAEAHRVAAVMKALESADPRTVQALAAAGMQPGQLIAQAFGGIADKAEKIGQFNVSSELLQSLLQAPSANAEAATAGARGGSR